MTSLILFIFPRRFSFKIFACLVVSALLFCSSGCLVPYAYPKVSWTRGVSVGPKPEEVRAFRVDVIGDIVDIGETDRFVLAPITPIFGDREPIQAKISLEYGIYVVGIALNYPIHHGHTTLVRLYRPGFQLVEIKSWEFPGNVTWIGAADLLAQEKAVDDLLTVPSIEAPRLEFSYGRDAFSHPRAWSNTELLPGCASAKHREVLLFAASEYDRLALLALTVSETDRQLQARLLNKSSALRALAGK
jgi:hypothetical protein